MPLMVVGGILSRLIQGQEMVRKGEENVLLVIIILVGALLLTSLDSGDKSKEGAEDLEKITERLWLRGLGIRCSKEKLMLVLCEVCNAEEIAGRQSLTLIEHLSQPANLDNFVKNCIDAINRVQKKGREVKLKDEDSSFWSNNLKNFGISWYRLYHSEQAIGE